MFKYAALLTALISVVFVGAAPLSERDDSQFTDITVLQYALTLEHLENNFYSTALAKYNAAAFESAGFPSWVRERFEQIAEHEASHVAFLQSAIGSNATKACTYKFPYTDPKSFVALASSIEGVGTSAYTGAAQYITNKAYITAAGSILATEARHQAWIASAAQKGSPWSGPYQTSLDPSGVYSIAAQFITSCPSTNPALPVKTFPALTMSPAAPAAGSSIKVSYKSSTTSSQSMYLAYFTGLSVMSSKISDGQTTIPKGLANMGTVYAAVVSTEPTASSPPTDDTMMSGLVILDFGVSATSDQTGSVA